jgi:predicted CXXCH cytochrome family protein
MKLSKQWRICFCLVALLGLVSLPASGASLPKTGVATSAHNVGGRGCQGCHAPHNGALANGGTDSTTGKILIWSRNFPAPANTFGIYDSATIKNKTADLGGTSLSTSTDVRMYSLLCLSCHDGVTSTFTTAMQNINKIGSKTSFGTGVYESNGLTNDHPVNMPYDPTKNTSLQAVSTVTANLPLFGTTNTVQCASCHEPHNNTNTRFLRQANDTTLCTSCHL